jgi:hypothetical protein
LWSANLYSSLECHNITHEIDFVAFAKTMRQPKGANASFNTCPLIFYLKRYCLDAIAISVLWPSVTRQTMYSADDLIRLQGKRPFHRWASKSVGTTLDRHRAAVLEPINDAIAIHNPSRTHSNFTDRAVDI